MDQKLQSAYPYNFFLNKITETSDPRDITFQDIFDKSLGELESSVQLNYWVDFPWLIHQYAMAGYSDTPTLILYERIFNEVPSDFITSKKIKFDFGIHHSKMMLLKYKDGSMRVVVMTANLTPPEWNCKTQGIWISPRLEPLPNGHMENMGDSPTNFRQDLISYLSSYQLPELNPWIQKITETDFSLINVFLVSSIPDNPLTGHNQLRSILSQHSDSDVNSVIVAQASSIGESDFFKEFTESLSANNNLPDNVAELKIMFPSEKNVKNYRYTEDDLRTLQYKQKFYDSSYHGHFLQWAPYTNERINALPHIKTYCRHSSKGFHWFLLTSANLSKSAWGDIHFPRSYEIGVLFLPKFLIKGSPLSVFTEPLSFPIPYALPYEPYGEDDKPFLAKEGY